MQRVVFSYKELILWQLKIMLDDGADVNLISEAVCLRYGIPITADSRFSLATSTSSGNRVLGVTPPIMVIYGPGSPNEIREWHIFLVIRGMSHLYDILMSKADTHSRMEAC